MLANHTALAKCFWSISRSALCRSRRLGGRAGLFQQQLLPELSSAFAPEILFLPFPAKPGFVTIFFRHNSILCECIRSMILSRAESRRSIDHLYASTNLPIASVGAGRSTAPKSARDRCPRRTTCVDLSVRTADRAVCRQALAHASGAWPWG
jgi:hypothetical protein